MKIIHITKSRIIVIGLIFIALISCVIIGEKITKNTECSGAEGFIKYAEFNPNIDALNYTMNIDINSFNSPCHISWIDLLAYYASKNNGSFKNYNNTALNGVIEKLGTGKGIDDIVKEENIQNFDYYQEVYSAVLCEFLGYDQSCEYGLKNFCPIAKNFPFDAYDDFGNTRTYGYTRRHLGHDLMAETGTPVIAVESGTVEAMGWNQYGGWRIGIRSYDQKRYYYYAHLRKDKPFAEGLTEGKQVNAGDVIGYVGRTGYSVTEGVNNIETSHLHFGMELIFDESQKESDNEIWVNLYSITKLLEKNKSEVIRNPETKEFKRK